MQNMVCTVSGVWVSKWKHWEPLEKGKPWKKNWVESDAESEGSGISGWKQEVSSTLLGLRESMEDWNELLREQNGYLQRIASYLDRGEVCSMEEELEEDSTIRE